MELSTEEKIKEAARRVFTQKGYAATRTRDIAEEAGINLAMLNYYFRSKEKLFNLIMEEKIIKLFGNLKPIINNEFTSLETKIEEIVSNYLNILCNNKDLPLFVMNEVRAKPEYFAEKLGTDKFFKNSHLAIQFKEKRPDLNSLHLILNLLGMILFPFIACPMIKALGGPSDADYMAMIEERRKLIPIWMNIILETK